MLLGRPMDLASAVMSYAACDLIPVVKWSDFITVELVKCL